MLRFFESTEFKRQASGTGLKSNIDVTLKKWLICLLNSFCFGFVVPHVSSPEGYVQAKVDSVATQLLKRGCSPAPSERKWKMEQHSYLRNTRHGPEKPHTNTNENKTDICPKHSHQLYVFGSCSYYFQLCVLYDIKRSHCVDLHDTRVRSVQSTEIATSVRLFLIVLA